MSESQDFLPGDDYIPTLLEYAKVIAWLWDERHNQIHPNGVWMSDFPNGLAKPFEDALRRVSLSRVAVATADTEWIPLTLEQLHAAAILLGLRCECFDPDTSPPTDWSPGECREPIPHHCECPFAPFELPDPEKCPTAYAFFTNERDRLLAELAEQAEQDWRPEGYGV